MEGGIRVCKRRCKQGPGQQTRLHAGAHIKAAWNNPPVSADEEMHAPNYDYSALDKYDDAYLRAVAKHLGSKPKWWGKKRTELVDVAPNCTSSLARRGRQRGHD
jgi:hypothetical protein